jgi:hypothetical protein
VRKPDFDAVVNFSPVVWNSYPAHRKAPRSSPERKAGALICATFLQYSARRQTLASNMRTALKRSGLMSTSAFLITTKVAPQMSVIRTRSMCAFSVRDTG